MDAFYFYFFCIKNTSKMKNTSLQDVFEVLIFVASEFNVFRSKNKKIHELDYNPD